MHAASGRARGRLIGAGANGNCVEPNFRTCTVSKNSMLNAERLGEERSACSRERVPAT